MLYGWHGRLLEVNLTHETYEYKEISKEALAKYIGGRGLGTYLFVRYTSDPDIDPLGEMAPIILTVGPLTATPAPTAGRMSASFRSPLTGTIADSNLGGYFGALMKMAGVDALVITGKALEPVYIYFDDKETEISAANMLWGKDNNDVTRILKDAYGKKASVLSIGRAGENLVRFASVMNDNSRAFGRGGLGAIFGAKNLKAIVTCGGDKKSEMHSTDLFNDVKYEIMKLLTTHPVTSKVYNPLGTAGILRVINEFGVLGTRNFRDNHFEGADNISGEELRKTYLVRNDACWGCPIMCGRISKVGNKQGSGPEFETLYALGSNLGIDDLSTVIQANFRANELGMDTISLGGAIAFAMEATETGTHDFGIRFGESTKLLPLIESIAHRDGEGNLLADGVMRVSGKLGGEDFAMHVKGLELPAYDPRGAQGMGLVYATSNRGACHLRGGLSVATEIFGIPRRLDRFQSVGKGTHVARYQDSGAVLDSLIVCRFTSLATSLQHWSRMYNAVTGEEMTATDLQRIGERIYNLEKVINVKLGFSKEQDALPSRLLNEPVDVAEHGRHVVDLDTMLAEYYEYRGWDEKGIPTREKLQELGLEEDAPWL